MSIKVLGFYGKLTQPASRAELKVGMTKEKMRKTKTFCYEHTTTILYLFIAFFGIKIKIFPAQFWPFA